MESVDVYTRMIEEDTGKKVNVYDSTVSWLEANGILRALKGEDTPNYKLEKLPDAIRKAEVIVFWRSPSDFWSDENPYDFKCSGAGLFYVNSYDPSDFTSSYWGRLFVLLKYK